MKELTREELPDDGTHFVVTWVYKGEPFVEMGRQTEGGMELFCAEDDSFNPQSLLDCANVRYWQFPEGETT